MRYNKILMSLSLPGPASFGNPSRRMPLAPLLVGGVVAAVVLALRSPVAAWIKGFLSEVPRPCDFTGMSLLDRGLAPQALRSSLLGRGKSAVAATCGAPRTAAGASGKVGIGRQPNFWSADTWYYPIDSSAQTAMAVRFENGIARAVEFFDTPRM
jgi:hypothetical protein